MTDVVAYGVFITTREGTYEELPYELYDYGAIGVETRDRFTMSNAPKADTVLYIGGFETEAARNRAADERSVRYPALEMTRGEMRDDGWSEGWKKFFKPVILEKLRVITPWMDLPQTHHQSIVIDPGQAFGTGGHATTKLMLQLIESHADRGFPEHILDVGTGSGVLAIAAVKLGASHVLGFDIEEPSVEATRKNAARNHVSESIEVMLASPEEIDGAWPLVFANIQLAVFLEHANAVARLVAPGGTLYISGILEEQRDRCISLWPAFALKQVVQEGEWLAMELIKSKAPAQ